jgi:hypothetical protein
MLAVPAGAVALMVRASVLVLVVGFGLNAEATPVGKPDAESVTLPVNPFAGVMVIVLVPLLPGMTVSAFGEAAMRKVGAALTVKLIVVVCVRLPEVPVMVTVAAPVVAVELTVRVSVLVVVAGFGLKAAVTPAGKPEAESDTAPLKPFTAVIVIVLDP